MVNPHAMMALGLESMWARRPYGSGFPQTRPPNSRDEEERARVRHRRQLLGKELSRVFHENGISGEDMFQSGIPYREMNGVLKGTKPMTPKFILSLLMHRLVSKFDYLALSEFYLFYEVDPHLWEMMQHSMSMSSHWFSPPDVRERFLHDDRRILNSRIDIDYVMGRKKTAKPAEKESKGTKRK